MIPTGPGRRCRTRTEIMETARRENYDSGEHFVLEYGELRFTFNEADFSERCEQAARKLGFIDGPNPPANGVGSNDRTSGSLAGMFNFNAPGNSSPLLLTCSGDYASSAAAACPLDPTP